MKAKILSVRDDADFRSITIGDESRKLSANQYLEREIQNFLDAHPGIQVRQLHFAAVPIVPRTAPWDTTNSDIEWEIEKSVLILYEHNTETLVAGSRAASALTWSYGRSKLPL